MKAAAGVGAGALIIPGVATADPTDGGDQVGPTITTDLLEYLPGDVNFPASIEARVYDNCSMEIEIDVAGTTRRDAFSCDPDGRACETVSVDAGVGRVEVESCYDQNSAIVENEITYCTRSWDLSWNCSTQGVETINI